MHNHDRTYVPELSDDRKQTRKDTASYFEACTDAMEVVDAIYADYFADGKPAEWSIEFQRISALAGELRQLDAIANGATPEKERAQQIADALRLTVARAFGFALIDTAVDDTHNPPAPPKPAL